MSGESNEPKSHVALAQYYNALVPCTDKFSIEQNHGGSMMPWVFFQIVSTARAGSTQK